MHNAATVHRKQFVVRIFSFRENILFVRSDLLNAAHRAHLRFLLLIRVLGCPGGVGGFVS
jgi:hypothetical protein